MFERIFFSFYREVVLGVYDLPQLCSSDTIIMSCTAQYHLLSEADPLPLWLVSSHLIVIISTIEQRGLISHESLSQGRP